MVARVPEPQVDALAATPARFALVVVAEPFLESPDCTPSKEPVVGYAVIPRRQSIFGSAHGSPPL